MKIVYYLLPISIILIPSLIEGSQANDQKSNLDFQTSQARAKKELHSAITTVSKNYGIDSLPSELVNLITEFAICNDLYWLYNEEDWQELYAPERQKFYGAHIHTSDSNWTVSNIEFDHAYLSNSTNYEWSFEDSKFFESRFLGVDTNKCTDELKDSLFFKKSNVDNCSFAKLCNSWLYFDQKSTLYNSTIQGGSIEHFRISYSCVKETTFSNLKDAEGEYSEKAGFLSENLEISNSSFNDISVELHFRKSILRNVIFHNVTGRLFLKKVLVFLTRILIDLIRLTMFHLQEAPILAK